MNLIEKLQFIFSQLSLICCNSTFIWILLIFLVIGFNIITARATTDRISDVRRGNRRIIPVLILALFSPIWAFIALILLIISALIEPGLYVLFFSLIIFGFPAAVLSFILLHLPDIVRRLLLSIGPYGERLFRFIEDSPHFIPRRLIDSLILLRARITVWLNGNPYTTILEDEIAQGLLSWIGLSSEDLLEQYVHLQNIDEMQRWRAIETLHRMNASPSLVNLGMDISTTPHSRIHSAICLELLNHDQDAIQVWDDIGRTSNELEIRLEAADHLITRLQSPTPGRIILDQLLLVVENLTFQNQLNYWYLQALVSNRANAITQIEQIARAAQEPADTIIGAQYLLYFSERTTAESLLENLVTINNIDPHVSRYAIRIMRTNNLLDGIIRIANNQQLSTEKTYYAAFALARLQDLNHARDGYRRIVQNERAVPRIRVDAALELTRFDQSRDTFNLLCQLARSSSLDAEQIRRVALVFAIGGWREKACQVLVDLIRNFQADREVTNRALRDLARIQSQQ